MNKHSCRKMSAAFKKAQSTVEAALVLVDNGDALEARKFILKAFQSAVKIKAAIGAGKLRWKIQGIVSELGNLSMCDGVRKSDLSLVRGDLSRLMKKVIPC